MKQLVMALNDLHNELGVEDTIHDLKTMFERLSNEELVELIKDLLLKKGENIAARSYVGIYIGKFMASESETVVYEKDEIDYQEFLLSMVALLFLTNIEDRPGIIVHAAYALLEIDREVAEQFRVDIAEEVYREYRKG